MPDQPYYYGSSYEAVPEPPQPPRGPLFPDGASCSLCLERGVVALAVPVMQPEDEIAVGPLSLCRTCSVALQEGPDTTLGARLSDEWDFDEPALMAAFLRARIQAIFPARTPSAQAAQLAEQGFEPIGEFTGIHEVAHVWPEQHRVALTDTGCHSEDDDGQTWLVRSPWPSLSTAEVLSVVWSWVERDAPARSPSHRQARVAEALAWNEQQALDWRRQPPAR